MAGVEILAFIKVFPDTWTRSALFMACKCICQLGRQCLGNTGKTLQASHLSLVCRAQSGRQGTGWRDCWFILGTLATSFQFWSLLLGMMPASRRGKTSWPYPSCILTWLKWWVEQRASSAQNPFWSLQSDQPCLSICNNMQQILRTSHFPVQTSHRVLPIPLLKGALTRSYDLASHGGFLIIFL